MSNVERSVSVFSNETSELLIVDRMQGKVRKVRTIAQKIRERRVRGAGVKDKRQLPDALVCYGGEAACMMKNINDELQAR